MNATGMVGMWNVGRGRKGPTTPTGQGFDRFHEPRSLGFDKDTYLRETGEYLTDAFTDAGIRFLEENASRPFFLYLAYHAIHAPFDPKPDLLKMYEQIQEIPDPAYAATVHAVDENVGRLMDALERLNISDNTVIAFTSDNGGVRQTTAPLRGGKGSLYEGGLRVPAALWGPGIRRGARIDTPILSMDFYPTLLELAGVPPPPGHPVDGVSLVPLLTSDGSLDRDQLFWHVPSYVGRNEPSSVIRKGDFKLIERFESHTVELFNLASDPFEEHNLANTSSATAASLQAEVKAWQGSLNAPRPYQANPDFNPTAVRKKDRDERGKGKQNK